MRTVTGSTYTSGDPTHKAGHPDSISLGDMARLQRLLRTAARQGRINLERNGQVLGHGVWLGTAPADPKGVPLGLHARWVSEALYRSWDAGVTRFCLVPAARRSRLGRGAVGAVAAM